VNDVAAGFTPPGPETNQCNGHTALSGESKTLVVGV